jgi:hypothetical protein
MLITGYDIRVIPATTGEIIRTLTHQPRTPPPRHRHTSAADHDGLRTPKTKRPEP